MKSKPMPKVATPVRQGDHILVSVPHYWGRGKDLAKAKQKMVAAGGSLNSTYWRIYSVHETTTIDEMGYINHPTDHAPVMIAESNPKQAATA